jgi:hypothetical protein
MMDVSQWPEFRDLKHSERLLTRKSSVTIARYRDLYWSHLDLFLVLGAVCSKLWIAFYRS